MFNQNLVYLREKTGLTQQQIADQLRIKLKRYQAYEYRRAEPPYKILVEICKFYNITDVVGFLCDRMDGE